MNCFWETIAGTWVAGLRMVAPAAVEDDVVFAAREQLQEALQRVAAQQSLYAGQLTAVAEEVRAGRSSLGKTELRRLLLRSRRLKMEQAALENKSRVMETQMNALESNEFNKVVLSTLQTSSKAMQKMGLNKDLQNTDQVISDLEEGMQVSSDMSTALSSNIGPDVFDDADLDAELGEILGLREMEPTFAHKLPVATNSMGPSPNAVEKPAAEGAAAEGAVAEEPAAGEAVAEKPASEKPAAGKPAGKKAAGRKAAAEKPAGEAPVLEVVAGRAVAA